MTKKTFKVIFTVVNKAEPNNIELKKYKSLNYLANPPSVILNFIKLTPFLILSLSRFKLT